MKGSHLADSASWNPHKMMGIPLQCSAILTKHDGLLQKVHSANAAYLFQKDKLNVHLDTGDKSIQCGRKVDVWKLWNSWKIQGDKGFEERIDRMFDINRYLRDSIVHRGEKNGSFKLVNEPFMTNLCFWYIPKQARGLDTKSEEYWKIVNQGPVYVKE